LEVDLPPLGDADLDPLADHLLEAGLGDLDPIRPDRQQRGNVAAGLVGGQLQRLTSPEVRDRNRHAGYDGARGISNLARDGASRFLGRGDSGGKHGDRNSPNHSSIHGTPFLPVESPAASDLMTKEPKI
jgi:hypothetical protein